MSDSPPDVFALFRSDLAEEVLAGFPRLKRVPQTDIIWFLDYFAGLSEAEREALLDALASSCAQSFSPQQGARELASAPALTRLQEARDRPGAKGGTRYTDVRMLCMEPSFRLPGGYHQTWQEHFTALNFQPRADLLPNLTHLKAAKAPPLRKLVKGVLKRLGVRSGEGPVRRGTQVRRLPRDERGDRAGRFRIV